MCDPHDPHPDAVAAGTCPPGVPRDPDDDQPSAPEPEPDGSEPEPGDGVPVVEAPAHVDEPADTLPVTGSGTALLGVALVLAAVGAALRWAFRRTRRTW